MGNSSVRPCRSLYRHGAICSRKLLFPRTQSDDWILKCGSHHRDKRCRRRCFPLWLKQAVHFLSQNSQFCATVPCTVVHFVINETLTSLKQHLYVFVSFIDVILIKHKFLLVWSNFLHFLIKLSAAESNRNNMKALLSEMSIKALEFFYLYLCQWSQDGHGEANTVIFHYWSQSFQKWEYFEWVLQPQSSPTVTVNQRLRWWQQN